MKIQLSVVMAILLVLAMGRVSAQSIQQAISTVVDSSTVAANQWTILAENANGSIRYAERNPDLLLAPASNTKLFATAAAWGLLGSEFQFESRAHLEGTLSAGVLTGNVNLVVFHDITWNTSALSNPRAGLDRIAQQLRLQGLNSVTGTVRVYGASLYDRGQFDDIRNTGSATLNAETALAFRDALVAAGVSVAGVSSGQTGFAPPGTLAYTHRSGDLNTIWGVPGTLRGATYAINRISHNPSADHLLRAVAYQRTGSNTLAPGAAEALAWLAGTAGLNATGIVMNDGSGLSSGNRFSARHTVDVVRYMVETFSTYGATLSISCTSGTLGSRLCSPSNLVGAVHAKTGSLSVSIATSGYIDNPFDGQRIFFSLISNASGIDQTATRTTQDNCIRVLGLRGVPISPVLAGVFARDGGFEAIWSDPGAQDEYLLQRSADDGATFDAGVVVPSQYIIETRNDLQDSRNFGDVEFFGIVSPSATHSTATGLTPGAGSAFARPSTTLAGDDNGRNDRIRFTPRIAAGTYDVYTTTFNAASANAPGVTVRISDAAGTDDSLRFDLTQANCANRWTYVATMEIGEGPGHFIEFDNATQTTTANEDRMNPAALRLVRAAGPMGTVSYREQTAAPRMTYRVAAMGGGAASKTSDVYTAAQGAGQRVAIVDGNDRWQFQTTAAENAAVLSHAFSALAGAGIARRPFDTVDNNALLAGIAPIADYRAAVWQTGEESTDDETFSTAEQSIVVPWLTAGGRLFVSGAEIGWDLVERGGVGDIAFYQDFLRADYQADDTSAATTAAVPVAGGIYDGIPALDFGGGAMVISFPDVIEGVSGSLTALRYGNGQGAGITYQNGFRVANFGFPWEMIAEPSARTQVMARTLDFLLAPVPPRGLVATGTGSTIELEWEPVDAFDLAGYLLRRAPSASGAWTLLTPTLVAATAFTDGSMGDESIYFYTVTAVDADGEESAPSAPASASRIPGSGHDESISIY